MLSKSDTRLGQRASSLTKSLISKNNFIIKPRMQPGKGLNDENNNKNNANNNNNGDNDKAVDVISGTSYILF